MTPLLREIGEPGPHDYKVKARTRLTEFTKDPPITYLDFLPVFNQTETPEMVYPDNIYLSHPGNQPER